MQGLSNIFSTDPTNIAEALLWQLPSLVVWKDVDSKFLGCNRNFSKLAGFPTIDSIMGKIDEDLKCEAANHAVRFRQQDKKAMMDEPQTILDIHRFADGKVWTCITKKVPLNNHKGQVIGCIVQMSEVDISLLTKLNRAMIKLNSKLVVNDSNTLNLSSVGYGHYNLSQRESECLFYILRGKTAKEIAKMLAISSRTVEKYIETLKFKFSCQTKNELVGKAIDEGLMNTIPQSILPDSLSKIIYADT